MSDNSGDVSQSINNNKSARSCRMSTQALIELIPSKGIRIEELVDRLPDFHIPESEEAFTKFLTLLQEVAHEAKGKWRLRPVAEQSSNPTMKLKTNLNSQLPPASPNSTNPTSPTSLRTPLHDSPSNNNMPPPLTPPIPRNDAKNSPRSLPKLTLTPLHAHTPGPATATAMKREAPAAAEAPPATRRRLDELRARKEQLRTQLEQKTARNEAFLQAQREREERELAEIAELERLNAERDAAYERMQTAEAEADEEEEIAQLQRLTAEQDGLAVELGVGGEDADDLFVGP